MEIRNIRHKGLRAFVEKGVAKGIAPEAAQKLADIVAFLLEIETIDEVMDLRKYKPHRLTGARAGTFSLSVTANWRLTFRHDAETDEIVDLDYEDYH